MANGEGFLRSPRVRVLWGKINLSSYDGDQVYFPKSTPVVYDVQVDLQAEGEGPTASMKWDPTGPGYKLYEWFISQPQYMKTQITIEYFYPRGKKVTFVFVWSGQEINYGNDMAVTIKMVSELAGLINANPRATAQAYDEKTGAAALTVYKKAQAQFGLTKFPKLLQFNPTSLAYANRAKITASYGADWTFGNNISNIAKQTGDMVMGINIGQAALIVMPPFSFPNGNGTEEVLNGATAILPGQLPDPLKRYGYLLGPSIINSMQRTYNWKPPQQDNTNNPSTQPLAKKPATAAAQQQSPALAPQAASANPTAAAARTSSPLGISGNRASPNILNKDNPLAQFRQDALNDEKASELSLETMMVPVLVGIKPHDIVYIPSLTGDFIEDWIVQAVGYSQNNGQVTVNIRATRLLGWGQPMNKKAAEVFETFAREKGLTGPNASLEAWDAYAWGLPGDATNSTQSETAASNLSQNPLSTSRISSLF